ncbi:trigger factor [Planctomycetes bacterium K23_9]|uniref:Trigger factor n=1 Tax=Stieleria marina TaxID=1930275 RepID=A0A517NZU5_9BACT|nr:Trigger factor [Planctomycetes bacterium K23_9]
MSTSTEPETTEEAKKPIQLDVKVESPQACLREVVVTIPQGEVQRYLKDAYDELVPEAQVPGFRAGRAPRKLVEKQFRDRVVEQVKGSLLMDSLAQVTESQDFSAISEPDFDYNAIEVPEEGDFKYQFSVEVRPEFKTPDWKGVELKKPVEEISDADVDTALARVLSRYATQEASDAPAEMGDKLLITAQFTHDGKTLSAMDEERVTLEERMTFSDATMDDFGKKLKGAKEGDKIKGKVTLGENASDESLRGKKVDVKIEVVEVLKEETPELTEAFLEELGDFETEAELRAFVRDSLTRQADYRTEQALRSTVVEALAGSASFELPPELVRRQTMRELERKVLELRRSGFDEDNVRRFVNATKQNAQASTESALREHFILEQIAEEEKIDAEPSDYDHEISLIAEQSDQPERRVRARLEKSGQMDALRNQIVERKVIEVIVGKAKVTEEPVDNKDADDNSEFAVYHSVLPTKDSEAIPEAKYEDNSPPEADKDTERNEE